MYSGTGKKDYNKPRGYGATGYNGGSSGYTPTTGSQQRLGQSTATSTSKYGANSNSTYQSSLNNARLSQ
jgi:hypothetical protein